MAVVIAGILFLASGIGLGVLLSRKLPELKVVPQGQGKSVAELREAARAWLRSQEASRYTKSPDLLLERALSSARVASLRAEAKTGEWLEKLRSRAKERRAVQSKNGEFGDGYWKQLRKEEEKQP